jgi:hypothetical protein
MLSIDRLRKIHLRSKALKRKYIKKKRREKKESIMKSLKRVRKRNENLLTNS